MSEMPTVEDICYACDSEVHKVYVYPCQHNGYCHACTVRHFDGISESDARLACDECLRQIPINFFQPILSAQRYAFLERAYPEWNCPGYRRMYCASPSCRRFSVLPEAPLDSPSLEYKQCPCEGNDALTDDIREAEETGARRCPKCNLLVYKDDGCAHIGLHGGHYGCYHQFCFFCGADWEACQGFCLEALEDAQRRHGNVNDEDFDNAVMDAVDDDFQDVDFEDFDAGDTDSQIMTAQEIEAPALPGAYPEINEILPLLQNFLILHREYIARLDPEFVHRMISGFRELVNLYTRQPDAILTDRELMFLLDLNNIETWRLRGVALPRRIADGYDANQHQLESILRSLRAFRNANYFAAEQHASRIIRAIIRWDAQEAEEATAQIGEALVSFGFD
ncbi:hypothetical protein E4T39_06257 [Aureobasidium subglaciale]|nr:hypothetical protein E4T39_06257 [Aureobasidium subglaciale]